MRIRRQASAIGSRAGDFLPLGIGLVKIMNLPSLFGLGEGRIPQMGGLDYQNTAREYNHVEIVQVRIGNWVVVHILPPKANPSLP